MSTLARVAPCVLAVPLALGTASVAAAGTASSAGASAPRRAAASPQSAGWAQPVTLFHGSGALLPAVSCASAELCVAVGAKGSRGIELSGAAAWSSPVVIDRGGGLAGVSCLPRGTCEAVGASAYLGSGGVTYRRLKGRWSAGPDTTFALASVSCASASFCAGVDNRSPKGHGFVFDGSTWSKPVAIDVPAEAISCPAAGFCAAISQSGKVLYYRNRTWSRATSLDPSGTLESVSCASASFCVAVDANGNALTYAGGRWSKPHGVDESASLTGVSCATTTFCVAVDDAGAVVSYDGSRWSSPDRVFGKVQFTSVSCPTAKFCVAVGQNSSTTAVFATTYEPSR